VWWCGQDRGSSRYLRESEVTTVLCGMGVKFVGAWDINFQYWLWVSECFSQPRLARENRGLVLQSIRFG